MFSGLIYMSLFVIGVYGFVMDCLHGHWAFVALELVSGGVIAIIRGIGYFFGIIGY